MSNTIYAVTTDEFFERIQYKNADGTVKDLTGHTSLTKITKYYGSNLAISIQGVVETPATDGIVKYEAAASIWSATEYGAHVYSRYLYDATNKVVDVVNGDLILIPAV